VRKLFFDNGRAGEPATHALIIGVSHYPAFDQAGGGVAGMRIAARLPSARRSALAIADFLRESANHWRPPIATIDLLINSDGCDGEGFIDISTIRSAFSDWHRRCDLLEQNTALFYFAGHGVHGHSGQYLLSSSFGKNPDASLLTLAESWRVPQWIGNPGHCP
jgi:hypothetical protein